MRFILCKRFVYKVFGKDRECYLLYIYICEGENLFHIVLLNYFKFTKFINSLNKSFTLAGELSFEVLQVSSFVVESSLILMK